MFGGRGAIWLTPCLLVLGCTLDQYVGKEDPGADTTAAADEEGDGDTGEGESGGEMRLDVETAQCEAPLPISCDLIDADPFRAIGINCPGGTMAHASYTGHPDAITVVEELGTEGTYPAQEGERFVVMSTGIADQIHLTQEEILAQDKEDPMSCASPTNCPSTSHEGYDLALLPPPIDVTPVHHEGDPGGQILPPGERADCTDDPSLVGTGDCSNTLWEQWNAGFDCFQPDIACANAHDYAEMRVSMIVPDGATGIGFDFAFGSIEYPNWWQSAFNDMFVAWLDSEAWTGNISFDDEGHPISLNAGFLDYKDAEPVEGCPDVSCEAPELEGFALEGHAATRWLNSTAGVRPGENITLIFAIFDLSDGILDSYVMLDGFEWTCSGNPPVTKPIP